MSPRFSVLVFPAALTMAAMVPAWSAAQMTQGYGVPKDAAAKPSTSTVPTAPPSSASQEGYGMPWSGPEGMGCPAGRRASGFCDTWRGGFIGLKYRCCFRRSYGYPYYAPSYPLFAQSFPLGGCHPIIGTVYSAGCGAHCGYWRGRAHGFPLAGSTAIVAAPGEIGSLPLPTHLPAVPPVKKTPAPKNTARLQLVVPEQAEVRVEGRETTRTGTVRQFVSPPLTPGKKFTYKIVVRYRDDNDRAVEKKRSIRVRANDRLRLDFTTRLETMPVSAQR